MCKHFGQPRLVRFGAARQRSVSKSCTVLPSEVVELFKDNEDVKFGDVNLAEDGVREAFGTPQNPGSGGWPTIRYYNKETGCAGEAWDACPGDSALLSGGGGREDGKPIIHYLHVYTSLQQLFAHPFNSSLNRSHL